MILLYCTLYLRLHVSPRSTSGHELQPKDHHRPVHVIVLARAAVSWFSTCAVKIDGKWGIMLWGICIGPDVRTGFLA